MALIILPILQPQHALEIILELQAPEIKDAIEGFTPKNNRSQIIQRASNKVIMDAYNANPNSMEAAISNLNSLSDLKKVAILGDMFELGDDSMLEHQKIVDQLSAIGLICGIPCWGNILSNKCIA